MEMKKDFIYFLAICVTSAIAITTLESSCRTTNTDPAKDGLPCQFPFVLRNKTYFSCTWDYSHITGARPWCSIKTDEKNNHITGDSNFGICEDKENCPIPPRYCGLPIRSHFDIKSDNFDVEIDQQPWMVSLGIFESLNKWVHQCGGSLVTSKHVLTAAHCFFNVFPDRLEGYVMRLGQADLSQTTYTSIERKIIRVLQHPRYREGKSYFDVGIAVADRDIEFTDFVRPICLPMRPVDDIDYLAGDLVTLAGWGNYYTNENKLTTGQTLKLINLKVLPKDECENIFSVEQLKKDGIPVFKFRQELPSGFTQELSCVGAPFKRTDSACEGDSGSPVIRAFEGTARGSVHFEQHFVVSSGLDCRQEATIYVRITDRRVLHWIQTETDTAPMLMVVGGYSKDDSNSITRDPETSLLKDIELLSPTLGNACSKNVRPIFGRVGIDQLDETNFLGATGQFTRNAAIVCGGRNRYDLLDKCYEYHPDDNKWREIPHMKEKRFELASTVNANDDLWIIGGTNSTIGSDSTEIYEYKPNGEGVWKKGFPLPPELRDTGIQSHCVVRLNSTHVFLGGGFVQGSKIQTRVKDKKTKKKPRPSLSSSIVPRKESQNKEESESEINDKQPEETTQKPKNESEDYDNEFYGGGEQLNRAWLFDGNQWTPIADMSTTRDRAACSLVQLESGQVRILVAGGCREWCEENPPIPDAEMYDPETDTWTRVSDLPYAINSAKMEIFDGYPTLVGGYILDENRQNGDLFSYDPNEDEWFVHETSLRIPRSSPAVFQVPKTLFKC